MKKLLLAGVVLAGCADSHVLINHFYREDGYTVKGMYGKFEWSEAKKLGTLQTGEGFEERFYYDRDHDWKPDEVKHRDEVYRRGTPGADEVFRRADEDMDLVRRRYELEEVEKEWRAMTPDERAQRARYFEK